MKAINLAPRIGLAFVLSVSSFAVHALGLGELDLQSQLNQRLSAHIPVFVADEIDPTDINVRLATDAHFERAGITRSATVSQLMFSPKRNADGKMVISIKSRSRVTEPMLSFVLEVAEGEVTTVKKYTVMLPPPR